MSTTDPDADLESAPPKRTATELPSKEELDRIATRQDEKAEQLRAERRRHQLEHEDEEQDRDRAATLIQKSYRGYRARREMQGFGLDAGTRWIEAVKEARYRTSTRPMSRAERDAMSPTGDTVRDRWRRVNTIAHHAGSDDTSDSDIDAGAVDETERRKLSERKKVQKAEREKYAKVMGLEYFLEMVDHKHRYGSNLRRYHAEWQKSNTRENFFHWLDYGEGQKLDLEDRPRKRLDTEQVRYLSREERQRYLVQIVNGHFCWAKNGEPVNTTVDFRDSINGIVPTEDKTPTWREVTTGQAPEPSPPGSGSDSDSLSGLSTGSVEDHAKYTNNELHDAKGLRKAGHISVDTVMNHMLRKTTKKNTWIFVADTSFRMFVGIKQSGAFQHSSFLRGARVSAAGLIKIKNGQIRKLSPLSGHYAPPLRNFREFLRSLKDAGADLSRLNTSRSYAVLLGLEGYLGAKRHYKTAEQGVRDMVNPSARREREAAAQDTSKSAARERQVLEAQERERRQRSFSRRMLKKLGLDGEADGADEDNGKGEGKRNDGVGTQTDPVVKSTSMPIRLKDPHGASNSTEQKT